ncbi:hypothetical protein GCM10027285_10080 [Oleiagrimonas citrea]|uniref:DUF4760 domain-containing protein n=1 Tax=Oleiagrimonas citrea TaxID=1665687 RepID=A0A846ZLU1_9GAMM|nr:hypothetical protein [Oleiagrimonas citrea]NKZ38431.1 hypothetical protein [Oleiagrimonas citrea]
MRDWVDYLSAISSAVTPVLVLVLTGMGWRIKVRFERSREQRVRDQERIKELEDKLREDRINTYNSLLEPFFILFTSDEVFKSDPKYKNKDKSHLSIGRMLTVDYRKIGFKLSLVADDAVIRGYNKMMQFFYKNESHGSSEEDLMVHTSQWIRLLSELLLEIRKSMGNQATRLDNWEMIEWFMSDVDELKKALPHNK